MKIYTKKGDDGTTGLVGNARVRKESLHIQLLGAIDELNAHIGLCKCNCDIQELNDIFDKIQHWLFDIGAEIATPKSHKLYHPSVDQYEVELLEHSIDDQTEKLLPLDKFILPGGSPLASHIHLARTVCRRVECIMFSFHEQEPVRDDLLAFVNRLSDWLFTAARTANHQLGCEDVKWEGWFADYKKVKNPK